MPSPAKSEEAQRTSAAACLSFTKFQLCQRRNTQKRENDKLARGQEGVEPPQLELVKKPGRKTSYDRSELSNAFLRRLYTFLRPPLAAGTTAVDRWPKRAYSGCPPQVDSNNHVWSYYTLWHPSAVRELRNSWYSRREGSSPAALWPERSRASRGARQPSR